MALVRPQTMHMAGNPALTAFGSSAPNPRPNTTSFASIQGDDIELEEPDYEQLLASYRRATASEARASAEVRRLQRENHLLLTFPQDVSEEDKAQERERFDAICRSEKEARDEVARLSKQLNGRHDSGARLSGASTEQSFEVNKLRASLRREQMARADLERQMASRFSGRTQSLNKDFEFVEDDGTVVEGVIGGGEDSKLSQSMSTIMENLAREQNRVRSLEVLLKQKDIDVTRLRGENEELKAKNLTLEKEMLNLEMTVDTLRKRTDRELEMSRAKVHNAVMDADEAKKTVLDLQRRCSALQKQLNEAAVGQAAVSQAQEDAGAQVWSEIGGVLEDRDKLLKEMQAIRKKVVKEIKVWKEELRQLDAKDSHPVNSKVLKELDLVDDSYSLEKLLSLFLTRSRSLEQERESAWVQAKFGSPQDKQGSLPNTPRLNPLAPLIEQVERGLQELMPSGVPTSSPRHNQSPGRSPGRGPVTPRRGSVHEQALVVKLRGLVRDVHALGAEVGVAMQQGLQDIRKMELTSERNARLEDELRDVKQVLSKARQAAKQAAQERDGTRATLEEKVGQGNQLAMMHQELEGITRKLNAAEEDCRRAQEEKEKLKQQMIQELQQACTSIDEVEKGREIAIRELELRVEQLEQEKGVEASRAQEASKRMEISSSTLSTGNSDLQHEIIRLEGQIKEEESRNASLLVQVDVLTARAVAAESRFETLDSEREQALQQADYLAEAMATMEEEKDSKIVALEDQVDSLKLRNSEMEGDISHMGATKLENDNELLRTRERLRRVEEKRETLEALAARVAAAMFGEQPVDDSLDESRELGDEANQSLESPLKEQTVQEPQATERPLQPTVSGDHTSYAIGSTVFGTINSLAGRVSEAVRNIQRKPEEEAVVHTERGNSTSAANRISFSQERVEDSSINIFGQLCTSLGPAGGKVLWGMRDALLKERAARIGALQNEVKLSETVSTLEAQIQDLTEEYENAVDEHGQEQLKFHEDISRMEMVLEEEKQLAKSAVKDSEAAHMRMAKAEVAFVVAQQNLEELRGEAQLVLETWNSEKAKDSKELLVAPGSSIKALIPAIQHDARQPAVFSEVSTPRSSNVKSYIAKVESSLAVDEGQGIQLSAMEVGKMVKERNLLKELDKERRVAMLAERRRAEEQITSLEEKLWQEIRLREEEQRLRQSLQNSERSAVSQLLRLSAASGNTGPEAFKDTEAVVLHVTGQPQNQLYAKQIRELISEIQAARAEASLAAAPQTDQVVAYEAQPIAHGVGPVDQQTASTRSAGTLPGVTALNQSSGSLPAQIGNLQQEKLQLERLRDDLTSQLSEATIALEDKQKDLQSMESLIKQREASSQQSAARMQARNNDLQKEIERLASEIRTLQAKNNELSAKLDASTQGPGGAASDLDQQTRSPAGSSTEDGSLKSVLLWLGASPTHSGEGGDGAQAARQSFGSTDQGGHANQVLVSENRQLKSALDQLNAELQELRSQPGDRNIATSKFSIPDQKRDLGALALIALPHASACLRRVSEQLATIESSASMVASLTLTSLALEDVAGPALNEISSSLSQHAEVVCQHVSSEHSAVAEATYAVALASTISSGRRELASHRGLVYGLSNLCKTPDKQMSRWATLALGCLSMIQQVRQEVIDRDKAFALIQSIFPLLSGEDSLAKTYACLAMGNLAVEADARRTIIDDPSVFASLRNSIHSKSELTQRYSVGALRNLAVNKRGRDIIMQDDKAMQQLKDLCASPDSATAAYAQAASENLEIARNRWKFAMSASSTGAGPEADTSADSPDEESFN